MSMKATSFSPLLVVNDQTGNVNPAFYFNLRARSSLLTEI
jgi:hypothetical protein